VTIKSLDLIPGKDRIVLASFHETTFRTIVAKNEFVEGETAVFIETGAILPVTPQFEFLRDRCYSKKYNGFRIRTMKMGGVYSDGLLIKSTVQSKQSLEQVYSIRREDDEEFVKPTQRKKSWLRRRFDRLVWKLFKVKLNDDSKLGGFPSHIVSVTDETQAQSITDLFEMMKGKTVQYSTKVDGMSSTALIDKGQFIVCSRKMVLYRKRIGVAKRELTPKNVERLRASGEQPQVIVAAMWDLPRKLDDAVSCAIQYETAGPGIQGNRLGLPDYQGFVFNVKETRLNRYFNNSTVTRFCNDYELQTVPDMGEMTFDFDNIVQLEKFAEGSYTNGHPREGVVFRVCSEGDFNDAPTTKMHEMMSFKMINPKFKVDTQKD
jgi:RNA ligase (TIGR02306 family)